MIKSETAFNTSLPAGYDGLFDWDYLKPAFNPTKIEPMDIDAMIERHGRFLVFETKEPGKEIPNGQKITLRALHKIGCFTIFFLLGKKRDEIKQFYTFWPNDTDPKPVDLSIGEPYKIVIDLTREWFVDACNYGKKTKR
jgi:hypothetical protein